MQIKNIWSFNKLDYSSEENQEQIKDLINRIQDKRRIIEFLQFLVYLTSMDNTLIQYEGRIQQQQYQNIKIQNVSFVRANFVRCNFSESQFNTDNISGTNLNGVLLFNCKCNNLRIQGSILFTQSVSHMTEIHQILVVMITLSMYGMSKQDNKKPNQMVILIEFCMSVYLLMQFINFLNGKAIYFRLNRQRQS
ncbi:unnamed protein product [Paramecium primaurelia]|uniref:Transmembrane protein n=1 Tax=Paramecium primaurelia TaxID=5886 RepID=A0A8S1Q934_PARPR|nr:unnamed protein product [Paramecium primaurelia]CAD8118977.1 unnamed protein product [Paramecium primaurelia]